MTPDQLQSLRPLRGKRVHIVFTDRQEIIANLNELSFSPSGEHLLYDQVEWSREPHNDIGSGAFYAAAHEIVSVNPVLDTPQA